MEVGDVDYTNYLTKIREYDQRTKAEIADRAVIGTLRKLVSIFSLISICLLNVCRRAL